LANMKALERLVSMEDKSKMPKNSPLLSPRVPSSDLALKIPRIMKKMMKTKRRSLKT